MVTEEYNENHYNIYDDPITLKELNKDQSPHQKNEFTSNSMQNSNLRLMTGVSGQGIMYERNDSKGSLQSPKNYSTKSQERRKKLTNSKEKDTLNLSGSMQYNNEDLVVEIKKLKASNSFTNKIVESAVKSQEKNDLNKNKIIKKK